MKIIAGLALISFIIIMLPALFRPGRGREPEEAAGRHDQALASLQRQVEQERARAMSLELELKNLREDISVSHAIVYVTAAVALIFLVLYVRERRMRCTLEKLLRNLSSGGLLREIKN